MPLADQARAFDIGHKLQPRPDKSLAATLFAAPLLDVKTKARRFEPARLRVRRLRKEAADAVMHANVRRWRRARRPANRRLVDVDHITDLIDALDPLVLAGQSRLS